MLAECCLHYSSPGLPDFLDTLPKLEVRRGLMGVEPEVILEAKDTQVHASTASSAVLWLRQVLSCFVSKTQFLHLCNRREPSYLLGTWW